MSQKFYITNAIAYVNGAPHIGHALEQIQGDCLARYHHMVGDDTRFLVGTDEHGTKVFQKAEELGMTAQELTDKNSQLFRDLFERLNSVNDDFIRTTDEHHKRGAQKLWKAIEAAGKFYEKEYEGLYCSGCEAFVLEKDLVDGKCPNHDRAPELLKEKNIFFKLSDYGDKIREMVESGELEIKPANRKKEFLSFIKDGLKDVSFSRPKEVLPWGVEVPGHEDQVMYVWCDALSNYLTALGYADEDELVAKYWPADVHLIGKDIIRFHCAYWPAMLLAAGLPTPRAVYVHGFVTSEGKKMSKSLGNVVNPVEVLDKYGTDAFRYYMLREIPTGDDGDFSWERFAVVYRDELQNTIGNLVRRVVSMTTKYFKDDFPNRVPDSVSPLNEVLGDVQARYKEGMENFNIKSAVEAVVDLANWGNKYIEDNKPWQLAKSEEDKDQLVTVMSDLLMVCVHMGILLGPIIPESAQKISDHIDLEKRTVQLGEPLFPMIEETD